MPPGDEWGDALLSLRSAPESGTGCYFLIVPVSWTISLPNTGEFYWNWKTVSKAPVSQKTTKTTTESTGTTITRDQILAAAVPWAFGVFMLESGSGRMKVRLTNTRHYVELPGHQAQSTLNAQQLLYSAKQP